MGRITGCERIVSCLDEDAALFNYSLTQRLTMTHHDTQDYDKSPIGFGVVVFCIAKTDKADMYTRFYESFCDYGEPNIPVDKSEWAMQAVCNSCCLAGHAMAFGMHDIALMCGSPFPQCFLSCGDLPAAIL